MDLLPAAVEHLSQNQPLNLDLGERTGKAGTNIKLGNKIVNRYRSYLSLKKEAGPNQIGSHSRTSLTETTINGGISRYT
jgi:hypothetical protein